MKNNKRVMGTLAALIPNIIFGFSFLFSKTALEVAHPLVILAARFSMAFLFLNILWLFGAVKINLRGKNLKNVVLMAFAQPLLYFIFELYGINATSSAISGVIISLVPIGVIILSTVFLREKPTKLQVVCSVISIAAVMGISILSDNGAGNTLKGVVLLLCAVVCAAVFNILSRKESKNFSPEERTYIMFAVGTVGFNIIAVTVLGASYKDMIAAAFSSPQFLWSVGFLAILSSVAAFLLYNYATTLIDAVRAASFSNIITVVSLLAGVFILGEQLSVYQLLLGFAVIAGVYGANRQH